MRCTTEKISRSEIDREEVLFLTKLLTAMISGLAQIWSSHRKNNPSSC